MGEAAPAIIGCAACAAMPDARDLAENIHAKSLMLSVPDMHCASCLSKIETALEAEPDVRRVRANLSLKRVVIEAQKGREAEDFIPILKGLGYDAYPLDEEMIGAREDQTAKLYLLRLGVAGFAMMNVMLLSVSVWTGASESTRDLLHWVSAFIAIPATLFAAQPFFDKAWKALKGGTLNMDVPISLAILLALFMSVYETSRSGENAYFDAALSLTFFLLIGRYLDHRSRAMARSAAQELAALETRKTIRIGDDGDEMVNIADLKVGDVLRILPGNRVPVDGVLLSGKSDVDTAFITGESLPVLMQKGADVRAGMLNLTAMFTMRAEKVGEDTSLKRIAKLVAIAENSRNIYTSLADRAARIYAPLVHILALSAFVFWLSYAGDWRVAMNVAIAVLVITCPCALGLAVPAVNTATSGRLFRKGVLLKSETALERLAMIDCVVFDKTGTLTEGTPELCDYEGAHLDVALALAQASAHPLSRALVRALEDQYVSPAKVDAIHEIGGSGVEGRYRGHPVRLGRASWVGGRAQSDASEVWLCCGEALTRFAFQDQLRLGAKETIAQFRDQGIKVMLLSGDHQGAVAAMAARLDVDEFEAEISPEDKAHYVEALRAAGHHVLMVGDGLNDTAALASADVSMAPGSAMDAARLASDIVVLSNDFSVVYLTYKAARLAKSRMVENFSLAAIYNAIAVPIALIGLATPFLAALAMSTSSILVVLNANRQRGIK